MSNFKIIFLQHSSESSDKIFKAFENKTSSVCLITKYKILDSDIINQFSIKNIEQSTTGKFRYIIFDDDIYKKEVYVVSKIKSLYVDYYGKNYNIIFTFVYNEMINYQPLFSLDIEYYMIKSKYSHTLTRSYTINTMLPDNINNEFIQIDDKLDIVPFIDGMVRKDNINGILF